MLSDMQMSRVMRKPTFCICKNKDADQLRGNREADQRLCFRYIVQALYSLNQNFKPLAIFCGLVCVGPGRKPECWFSHDAAQIFAQMGRCEFIHLNLHSNIHVLC